ncbi:MAG TPA: hypothetical protein VMR00_12600 [Streptosporangiaceae bacterium]|jgi:hypothetical protein|nr:hypothetical protein [Streptosporangiaceae bacterium]
MKTPARTRGPLTAGIRSRLRRPRAARRSLERDLASYTSAADIRELEAMLERHSEQDTAEIRSILAARR